MALPPGTMVFCDGCGFHAEPEDVVTYDEHSDERCLVCLKCQATPALRESYRRGFNAGLDAMAEAVRHAASTSNLRRRAP